MMLQPESNWATVALATKVATTRRAVPAPRGQPNLKRVPHAL